MDRLFVNLGADGRVSVSTELDGEYPSQVSEPTELSWPMNVDELENLRWYLEDYLEAPFGVYEQRGEQVANQLSEWGRRVFDVVFGVGPARDAYVTLRTRATGSAAEIVFQSAVPGWLALPWELLRDPHCRLPLALETITISRSLTGQRAPSGAATGERLRVLMVISRPKGAGDVGYRMIARPLLERLEAVRGQVDLVVLRPPTLDALDKTLLAATGAGEPFQVVHFDGHGALVGARAPVGAGAPGSYAGIAEQGVLVFEKPGGGADHVPATDVAWVLGRAKVPVVVLNACQSGAIGKELEAAVATRLLVGGASSVVAMAYRVYAVAAAEFMTAFYQRLFAGDRVADAVTAGRERLHLRRDRPSPKGPMPLDDWMVPVHYTRRDVHFPNLRTKDALGSKPSIAREQTDPLAPRDTFVGRDELFYQLEVAARLQHVVLLHGPGGTGKTELAKAFGRWCRDTGGVDDPNLVILHSFEPGVASFSLAGVLSTIGQQVIGTEFELLEADERQATVLKLLAERRALVVWDNFESVYSMPDPTSATPTLDQTDRSELLGFLAGVAADGRSAVLITSRSPEPWLGDVRRMPIDGLTTVEASEYADHLLTPYPNAQLRRDDRAFGELMEWLAGHPLSMRLTLRHLDTTKPRALLDGLRGLTPLPGEDDGGRTSSLPASISYSIRHLHPDTRRLLVAVSLFHGVVDGSILDLFGRFFSRLSHVSPRFSYTDQKSWNQVLKEASVLGLLTPLNGATYAVHPALPAYLFNQWRAEEPETFATQRETANLALLNSYAAFGVWAVEQIVGGDTARAYSMIGLQRRTLGYLLGYALDHGHWLEAVPIAGALDHWWNTRGLHREANEWVARARYVLESATGTPPALDDPAAKLWLGLVVAQANRQREAGLLDSAERTFLEIRDMLVAQPASAPRSDHLDVVYGGLGHIAQERGRWDEAEAWHHKSLTHVAEEFRDQHSAAANYDALGIIAMQQSRLDEAENWFRKSLTISEELRDQHGIASSWHQLGIIAQRRGQRDRAGAWLHKSLTINEKLGDQHGAAKSYYQLGVFAVEQRQLSEAENWFRKSLVINEKLDLQAQVVKCYYQLGVTALGRQQLDQAESWLRRALTIGAQLDDWPDQPESLWQLALVAASRRRFDEALEWTVRSATLFDKFPHPANQPVALLLATLTAPLGVDNLKRCWQKVTGQPVPIEVLNYVEANKPNSTADVKRIQHLFDRSPDDSDR